MRMFARIGTPAFLLAVCIPSTAIAQRSPAIGVTHIDPAVLALACAPTATAALPNATLRVTGGQDTHARHSFAQGDFVTLNAGSRQGLEIGQEFFVRRLVAPRGTALGTLHPGTTRTAGWIRVYAVDEDLALATITYACDAIQVGDYLEPLALPVPTEPGPKVGKPERQYARVTLGNERRTEFAAGDYFVIDRGATQGVTVGTHFVIYRWKKKAPDNFLASIAEAVAVLVQDDSATLSITNARDAVKVDDLVAVRKEATN